jgi:hypothetical protein
MGRDQGDAMSETKWTPGKWEAARGASYQHVGQEPEVEWFVMLPSDDVAICADVLDPKTQKPSEANARLIAAAPDLYAALVSAESALTYGGAPDNPGSVLDVVRAALARARGES